MARLNYGVYNTLGTLLRQAREEANKDNDLIIDATVKPVVTEEDEIDNSTVDVTASTCKYNIANSNNMIISSGYNTVTNDIDELDKRITELENRIEMNAGNKPAFKKKVKKRIRLEIVVPKIN